MNNKIIISVLSVIYIICGSILLTSLNNNCFKLILAIAYVVGCAIVGYALGGAE